MLNAPAPREQYGPWAAQQVLGRGRASQVRLARASDGRCAALKLAPLGLAREHRLLLALAHPHVVRAFGQGQGPAGEWLALEHVPRATSGPVAPGLALRWAGQAAAALAHLHRRGWVHRDLKPAHLRVRADGTVALCDFGCAVPAGHRDADGGPRLVGSAPYAAPEQLQGAPAAPAADLYGLGAVLHEWLTGRPPFDGTTPTELLAQHLAAPVPRLPAPLAAWQPHLDSLLAKDPDRRTAAGLFPAGPHRDLH